MTATNLIVNRDRKPITEATKDELLSARAHAWRSYFNSKEDKPFGMSFDDYDTLQLQLREGFGIDAIEGELVARGIHPKDKSFERVAACFDPA